MSLGMFKLKADDTVHFLTSEDAENVYTYSGDCKGGQRPVPRAEVEILSSWFSRSGCSDKWRGNHYVADVQIAHQRALESSAEDPYKAYFVLESFPAENASGADHRYLAAYFAGQQVLSGPGVCDIYVPAVADGRAFLTVEAAIERAVERSLYFKGFTVAVNIGNIQISEAGQAYHGTAHRLVATVLHGIVTPAPAK